MSVPSIGVLLRARKRTRVAVVEFHVSLYPISVSSFLSLYARYMFEYNDWNSLYSAESLKTQIHPPPPQFKRTHTWTCVNCHVVRELNKQGQRLNLNLLCQIHVTVQ